MNEKTASYAIAGTVGGVLAIGVIVLARSLFFQSSVPSARAVNPDIDIDRTIPAVRPSENYQMNPPEAGLSGAAKAASPKTVKAPVSKPRRTASDVWLKPAPVSPKSTPLGPLSRPSIFVEKSALRLTVFDGDRGVKSYRVAAGANRGDKQIEGDRKTPEGDFYICIRKTAGQTPYTRSMGLSYPNLEDAARGRRRGLITASQYNSIVKAITNRLKPPWQTKLGGAIMIHGKREGRTGTLGCVALDDDDIKELYRRLPLNTPVRIIP